VPQITGLSIAAFDLRIAGSYKESAAAIMEILYKLEEKPLREVGDNALITEMDAMNENLQQLPDDYICNMQENQMKRITILQQLYANLEVSVRLPLLHLLCMAKH